MPESGKSEEKKSRNIESEPAGRSKFGIKSVLIISITVVVLCSLGLLTYFFYRYNRMQSNDYTRVDWYRTFKRSLGFASGDPRESQKNARIYEQGALLLAKASMARASHGMKKARFLYQSALDKFEEYPGLGDIYAYTCLDQLAEMAEAAGHYRLAEGYRERQVEAAQLFSNKNSKFTSTALASLASLYEMEVKYEKALPLRRRCYEIDCKGAGASSINAGADLYWIANDYWWLHDLTAAARTYVKAERCKHLIADDEWMIATYERAALCFFDQEEYQEAVKQAETLVDLMRRRNLTDRQSFYQSLISLSEAQLYKGDGEVAHKTLVEANQQLSGLYKGDYHQSLWKLYTASLLMQQHHFDEARDLLELARPVFEKAGQTLELAKTEELLGECYLRLGDLKSAESSFSTVFAKFQDLSEEQRNRWGWMLCHDYMFDSYEEVLKQLSLKEKAEQLQDQRQRLALKSGTNAADSHFSKGESGASSRSHVRDPYRMQLIEEYCRDEQVDSAERRMPKIDYQSNSTSGKAEKANKAKSDQSNARDGDSD